MPTLVQKSTAYLPVSLTTRPFPVCGVKLLWSALPTKVYVVTIFVCFSAKEVHINLTTPEFLAVLRALARCHDPSINVQIIKTELVSSFHIVLKV